MSKEQKYAGVDASKDYLDIAVAESTDKWRFGNNQTGIKKAIKEFNAFISVSTLLPNEKTPQGYLRSKPIRAIGKTQLEIISDELEAISFTLCN